MNTLPTRTYTDGLGDLDASIEWDRDEESGDLVFNVVTNDGTQGAGIRLNRRAVADLISDLAGTLR